MMLFEGLLERRGYSVERDGVRTLFGEIKHGGTAKVAAGAGDADDLTIECHGRRRKRAESAPLFKKIVARWTYVGVDAAASPVRWHAESVRLDQTNSPRNWAMAPRTPAPRLLCMSGVHP